MRTRITRTEKMADGRTIRTSGTPGDWLVHDLLGLIFMPIGWLLKLFWWIFKMVAFVVFSPITLPIKLIQSKKNK